MAGGAGSRAIRAPFPPRGGDAISGHRSTLVCAVDFPPGRGGIQQYVLQLWGDGSAGRPTVLAPRMEGDREFDASFPGVVKRFPAGSGIRLIPYLAWIAAQLPSWILRRAEVHVANIVLAPAIVPYLPFLRKRLVVWTYATEVTHPKMQFAIARVLRHAARVVTISDYNRSLALERGARPERIVKIVPGGDSFRRNHPVAAGEDFRREHGVAPDAFLILTVGRLSPINRYKGYDRAIDVAQELRRRGRSFRWLVAGEGEDLAFYRDAVAARGVSGAIEFLGGIDDDELARAYAAADLFALLSREERTEKGVMVEGFGIVFVEANSFGVPVVGLRRGGVPDAVIDGETGVLLDDDDPVPIASAVERLMDDPAARKRLGENGMRRAMGEASWDAARERMRAMLADFRGWDAP